VSTEDARRNGPPRDSEEGRSCEARRCYWNLRREKWDSHKPGCPFNPRREQVAKAPKSRRRGRITDHDSARKELEGMAQLAQDDERLSPCDAFVYGLLASRGWRHGSVFVMAAANYLSEKSNGAYSTPQCRRALERLEILGYIEPVSWKRVAKADSGLYAYAKRSRRGSNGGRWPAAFLLKQDPPGNEDARPDNENPIAEMFGLVPA
jgi:hypothetical protein